MFCVWGGVINTVADYEEGPDEMIHLHTMAATKVMTSGV